MPKLSDFDHGRYMDKKSKKKAEKIPGMADWIKSKEKKNLYKEAFIGEIGTGRTLGAESHNKNRPQFKDDPFRTTKTVANVELANHGLNLATDIGAAGLAAAGGFKPLMNAVRKHGLKGIKQIGQDPVFREDIGKMLKAQKYILPVGAAITGAYVGKALYDDIKHKQMKDQVHTEGPEMSQWQMNKAASDHSHDKELATFVRVILNDRRPDSKYDQKELKMGVKVEHEHTSSSFIAKKIAKDHLDEIPDYYTRLKFLEELAKKQMGKKG